MKNAVIPRRSPAPQRGRRLLLQAGLASLVTPQTMDVAAAAAPDASGLASAPAGKEVRLALLMGNSEYPSPFDLPPIPKNVRDTGAALEKWGFAVEYAVNVNAATTRKRLDEFLVKVAAEPRDATVLFYFSGHGVQVEATNLLLPAGLDPSGKPDALRGTSVKLIDDVIGKVPKREGGTIIAIVDACRTSLVAGGEQGLNQIVPPENCLIAFSTAAGRPAIAPESPDINTFYTASLVKLLNSTSEETEFRDLFRLVRSDVRNTMQHFPIRIVQQFAQDPYIADGTKSSCTLAQRGSTPAPGAKPVQQLGEEESWKSLTAAAWPSDVVDLADAFLKAYPKSPHAPTAQSMREGAIATRDAFANRDVRLFKTAFELPDGADDDLRRDLMRAVRGDKDASARMAGRQKGRREAPEWMNRYEGWLQLSAMLGNGIASYELALHYRRQNQPLLSSQWEDRAYKLGYTPPPTLDNVRK